MKLKIFITATLLLTCICTLHLHAQVGEQRHNFALGINGGINLNSVSFAPKVQQKKSDGNHRGHHSTLHIGKILQNDLWSTT